MISSTELSATQQPDNADAPKTQSFSNTINNNNNNSPHPLPTHTIRTASHEINISYIQITHSTDNNFEKDTLTQSNKPVKHNHLNHSGPIQHFSVTPLTSSAIIRQAFNPAFYWNEKKSIMEFLCQHPENISKILDHLNQFCQLDSNHLTFMLWHQSSSVQYPIDLRIIIKHTDQASTEKWKEIERKLRGLASQQAADIEIKYENNHTVGIIKTIQPAALTYYLNSKNDSTIVTDKILLEKAIIALKETFPDILLIQDLYIYTLPSSTRNYPHIRSKHYWPQTYTYTLENGAAISLLVDIGAIRLISRNADQSLPEKNRTGYVVIREHTPEFQLIVDICDYNKLITILELIRQSKQQSSHVSNHSLFNNAISISNDGYTHDNSYDNSDEDSCSDSSDDTPYESHTPFQRKSG